MFPSCKGPIWRSDDFSQCFEADYLEVLFPLIASGASLTVLGLQLLKYTIAQKKQAKQKYRLVDESDDNAETEDSEEDVAGLTLQRTITNTNVSFKDIDTPKGEIALVSFEIILLLGHVAVNIAGLWLDFWGERGPLPAIAQIVTWSYILGLVVVRLILSLSSRPTFPRVWNHTAILYFCAWILEAILFRSAIIHPRGGYQSVAAYVGFGFTTALLSIALTSRKGNKAVELEYEGDLEPSREITASILSLYSFAWVDHIVWKGYRRTLEISDVWNVAAKDKAEKQLENFRQLKKTSSLAVRLLLYFKRMLLIQGLWAMVANVFAFAPTLLLRAILQYLEDPASTPTNAAWLYVILLFFAGVFQAIGDGQALWIGRKISIRIRGIVIGEIYSKALRRKAAAALDDHKEGEAEGDDKSKSKKKPDDEESGKTESDATSIDAQANNGTIINLMSIDAFKVSEVSSYLHFVWASVPVQLTISILLLYNILGLSSLAGIVLMLFVFPLNYLIARSFQSAQKRIMKCTDARIHTTNEVLQNIRIIKYFAWEQRFSNQVKDKREAELAALRFRYMLWSAASTVWSGFPIVITFASFFVYTVIEKKALVPSVAFPALSTFSLLRVPLDYLADMVAHVQESKVSIDRVDDFLKEEETEKYLQVREARKVATEPKIALKNATLTWGSKQKDKPATDAFRLLNMDVEFELGRLNIISGPTGSGKTSLLMALLGEMKLLEGQVIIPGGSNRESLRPDPETGLVEAVAYAAQQPWLVNDTIKENILFASPYNARRYKQVVHACALERDFQILDAGDGTLVGEKGIALSGGQKQRISLARAMYSNCRHLLLDDCLSAVDSHTAKHIFEEAIMGDLMKNRTCILVTHNVTLTVPRSSFVVALSNGKIVSQGPPEKVIASGALGDELLKSRPTSTAPSRVPSDLEEQKDKLTNGNIDSKKAADDEDAPVESTNKGSANARVEAKAEGSVKLTTIKMYLGSMGSWPFWLSAVFVFVISQAGSIATNVWIREWANSYEIGTSASSITYQLETTPMTSSNLYRANFLTLPQEGNKTFNAFQETPKEVNAPYYLGVYAALGALYLVIVFTREIVLFLGSLHAARKIHDRLLEGVMRAKFKFFDATPLGQLMNRFSRDVEAVDQEVSPVAIGMMLSLASVIAIVILITAITPGFLIAGFFISAIYTAVGIFYINSSRDLKRMESVQRSPLYQQFGETLAGVVTIRAYGDEARFVRDNHNRVNTHNRPFIYLWATNRWLAFRVDVAGALVSFFAGVFVIRSVGVIDPGAAGLSLTYAITFTENVLWLVRLYSQNEQNMNSVERVKEYIEVEQEAPRRIPETQPPANWPSHGAVEFIGYTTRYRPDLDPVLRNVSFKVKPGNKVGIVGRTGAGKSSLALALFRGLEAEQGKILIDDVDIGLIGLQDLREAITIVPQDPTLFTGTLRTNLDPFGIFTDEEIFTALRRVQLISDQPDDAMTLSSDTADPATPSTPQQGTERSNSTDATLVRVVSNVRDENKNIFRNLQSPVSESGSNLSQGQRQLLCLARALLKNPRVLMMDEATASIDYATDAKIQDTLRELKDNTVITIAHRLQTIIDYDRVLVLDKGEVIEFDDPYELIKKENGLFKSMCETSGEFETLKALAKKSYDSKRLIDDE